MLQMRTDSDQTLKERRNSTYIPKVLETSTPVKNLEIMMKKNYWRSSMVNGSREVTPERVNTLRDLNDDLLESLSNHSIETRNWKERASKTPSYR